MVTLRADTFQFLRKTPVNLSRYLPHWLYNDKLFKDTQDALNIEHERYRLKLMETAREFFVSTATAEGIESFERMLRITPTGDLELRRKVIALKLARQFVPTPDGIKNLMREFLRTGNGKVDVEETNDNRLKLILNNGDFWWDLLYESLMEWLPAHLLIYDILIINDLGDFNIYYAQPIATSDFVKLDLSLNQPPPLIIAPKMFVADFSADKIDFANADEALILDLKIATSMQISETAKIACGDTITDEETRADFERYLRERWLKFKNNPVVKWYKHGTHGDDYDGEISDDEEEFFPVDTDFLRLYFDFEDSDAIRYLTILQPRENVSGAEINALSIKSKNMLLSRRGDFSNEIIRAVYVKKSELKII